jgi:hypothetical protein
MQNHARDKTAKTAKAGETPKAPKAGSAARTEEKLSCQAPTRAPRTPTGASTSRG